MSQNIKLKYHKELPNSSKINQIIILKSGEQYYASFSVTFSKTVFLVFKVNLDIKTCSNCGQINKNLKLSDRVFECICSLTEHRDTNASINI